MCTYIPNRTEFAQKRPFASMAAKPTAARAQPSTSRASATSERAVADRSDRASLRKLATPQPATPRAALVAAAASHRQRGVATLRIEEGAFGAWVRLDPERRYTLGRGAAAGASGSRISVLCARVSRKQVCLYRESYIDDSNRDTYTSRGQV